MEGSCTACGKPVGSGGGFVSKFCPSCNGEIHKEQERLYVIARKKAQAIVIRRHSPLIKSTGPKCICRWQQAKTNLDCPRCFPKPKRAE